ncbi:unnamed protein product [Merluccius merluccius]
MLYASVRCVLRCRCSRALSQPPDGLSGAQITADYGVSEIVFGGLVTRGRERIFLSCPDAACPEQELLLDTEFVFILNSGSVISSSALLAPPAGVEDSASCADWSVDWLLVSEATNWTNEAGEQNLTVLTDW